MSDEEIKKMQKQQQYDPNKEALNKQKSAQQTVGSKVSGSKKKANGSSKQTKSITSPRNQHSDFTQDILNILDSQSPMKRGRIYNYITSNILDNIDIDMHTDNQVCELSSRLTNMHSTVDRNTFSRTIDNEILSLIFTTMEQHN